MTADGVNMNVTNSEIFELHRGKCAVTENIKCSQFRENNGGSKLFRCANRKLTAKVSSAIFERRPPRGVSGVNRFFNRVPKRSAFWVNFSKRTSHPDGRYARRSTTGAVVTSACDR